MKHLITISLFLPLVIFAQGIRITGVKTDIPLVHAYYGFENKAVELTLADNSLWYNIGKDSSIFRSYESDGIDSIGNDTLQLKANGHFEFIYHIVFTGSNGVFYNLRIFNVTKGLPVPVQTSAVGSPNNRTALENTAYCTFCEYNDKIILQIQSESNSQTITLLDGSILIIKTHN